MAATEKIDVSKPRYIVAEASDGSGYGIVDTKGNDQPYMIDLPRVDEPRTAEELAQSLEFTRKAAEHWAYTWNIVELGYCGACEHKFAEGEQRYPAVGFHHLDKTICFSCACSQED